MGQFKELVTEIETSTWAQLDQFQEDFFRDRLSSSKSDTVFHEHYGKEDATFEPDVFTLTLPSFPMAQVS